MSSRHLRSSFGASALLVALGIAELIALPAVGADQRPAGFSSAHAGATVHFRTAPFDFGHEGAAPAEFVLVLRPPLA